MKGNDLAAVAAAAATGASSPRAEAKTEAAAGTPAAAQAPTGPAPTSAQQPATQPATEAAQQPASSSAVAALDAARAEGRTATLAYVREVNDLCAIAGQPEKARAFIDAEAPVADVRKQLLDSRAQADSGQRIATQHSGTGSTGTAPQSGALSSRMMHLVGKKGA